MKHRQNPFSSWLLAGAAATALGAAAPVLAQNTPSPSQVTPPSTRPPQAQPSVPTIVIPATAPQEVPAGAEQLSVTVGNVTLEGAPGLLPNEEAAVVAALQGKRVTAAEIFAAARTLEQAYANAGYVLIRVAVPPQEIVDGGPVRIVVIDGFIEAVDGSALPERVRDTVVARVQFLVGRHGLTLKEIERGVLLAEVYGLSLHSTLARGDTPGGVKLILSGPHKLVTGSLGIDNRLPDTLDTWAQTISLSLNSALGFGEQIYASVASPPGLEGIWADDAERQIYGVGALLPLGTSGLVVNPEYTFAKTRPDNPAFALDTEGEFERFSLRAYYPAIRSRSENLWLNFALDVTEETQSAPLFATDLSLDRLRVVRIGADYTTLLPSGANVRVSATLSQGLDMWNARDQAEAAASNLPLSRFSGGPDFTKIEGTFAFGQALGEHLIFNFIAKGQYSFSGSLLSSEQLSFDGPDAVSVLTQGAFPGDHGFSLRGELAAPIVMDIATIQPYVFAAYGASYIDEPSVLESAETRASAYGIGARLTVDGGDEGVQFAMAFEAGWLDPATPNLSSGHRIGFSLTAAY